MSDNDGPTDSSAISRREALKKAALAAGVVAWSTPVIAGVFSAPASAQTACSPAGDSDVVIGTITTGYDTNTNCGRPSVRPVQRAGCDVHARWAGAVRSRSAGPAPTTACAVFVLHGRQPGGVRLHRDLERS